MKSYSANIGGITLGLFSILVFAIYYFAKLAGGGSFEYIRAFLPMLDEPGFLKFIGAAILSGLWGYFLGYLFIYIYNFYQKKFMKKVSS